MDITYQNGLNFDSLHNSCIEMRSEARDAYIRLRIECIGEI